MNRGFISKVIVIIIALASLYYFFDWSIFDALKSEKGMATVEYIRDILNTSWAYIKSLAVKLYEIF